ncbi:MAG: hypothetical protein AAF434_10235 [Pseudomonadota bacterium]
MARRQSLSVACLLFIGAMQASGSMANSEIDLDLLEFLVDWQDDSGEFVDPFALPESFEGDSELKENENDET